MKYIKNYSEKINENSSQYQVVIEWEHGDADLNTEKIYNFSTEKELKDYLNFIYELRNFIPNSGFKNQGFFADGHYEREVEYVEKMVEKHDDKLIDLVEKDLKFNQSSGHKFKPFDLKVLDAKIYKDIKHNKNFFSFHYIILGEIPEGKLVTQLYGYDPMFESKFNKEKYDGLPLYEV